MPKSPFKKNSSLPHRLLTAEDAESALQKEWPPVWSVTFADMTTLLMTAFVLWYSLTAMKIPPELLAIKKFPVITSEDTERLKEKGAITEIVQRQVVSEIKKLTPKQESAIEELKKIRELHKELKDYVSSSGLEGAVDVEAGVEAVLVTPRAPLLFAEGEAELKKEAFGLLDKIVHLLKEQPYYQLRIEGHTDTKPIDPFHRYKYPSNWELSYARAVAVAKYLISRGVSPTYLGVTGYGEEKPLSPNDTEENRVKNRRVEIYISFAKSK